MRVSAAVLLGWVDEAEAKVRRVAQALEHSLERSTFVCAVARVKLWVLWSCSVRHRIESRRELCWLTVRLPRSCPTAGAWKPAKHGNDSYQP